MYSMLIVDDEFYTREYFKSQISKIDERWSVGGEASNGLEAVDLIKNKEFDLVITDIKMPEMDGLELCQFIYEYNLNLKIIIISGYDEFSFVKKAIKYGVQDYILKPIVIYDLKKALDKVTNELENERISKVNQSYLENLSKEAQGQVIRKYLNALVNNSIVKIQSLTPLIQKMGAIASAPFYAILVLQVDEELILQNKYPLGDLGTYKYILNQISIEYIEERQSGYVFCDEEESTVILLYGNNNYSLYNMCRNTFSDISKLMKKYTKITITAGLGEKVDNLSDIYHSYAKATELLQFRLFHSGGSLYTFNDINVIMEANQFQIINKAICTIKAGILDNNESFYTLGVINFIENTDTTSINSILRNGIYLANQLVSPTHDLYGSLLMLMQDYFTETDDLINKESIVALYTEIVKLVILNTTKSNDSDNDNEHAIVNKAKEFIYYHFDEPISLLMLAEYVGVTQSYLSHIFHKSVGESYIKFLTRIRMEQAANLLKSNPSIRLVEVSEKVGYISVKHFSYVFKQYYNVTPGEYQNKFFKKNNKRLHKTNDVD